MYLKGKQAKFQVTRHAKMAMPDLQLCLYKYLQPYWLKGGENIYSLYF